MLLAVCRKIKMGGSGFISNVFALSTIVICVVHLLLL